MMTIHNSQEACTPESMTNLGCDVKNKRIMYLKYVLILLLFGVKHFARLMCPFLVLQS